VALGLWLSALAIRYRDVKFVVQFVIRMLMYTAPIVYSASAIPEVYRFIYSLNPLVSVIEGIRSSVLGTSFEWIFIIPGFAVSVVILITGVIYFKKMERVFSDVI
jgi:lipopolysaccharide transport system permease protein